MIGVRLLKGRKAGLYLLIIMYLCFIPLYHSKAGAKEAGIKEAFIASGAQVVEYNVNTHVSIQNQFTDPKEVENLCWELSKRLGIQKSVMESNHSPENVQAWIQGEYKEGQNISVIVQSSQLEDVRETNIMIDLMGQGELLSFQEMGKDFKDILGTYGSPRLSSWISGTYQGKLDKEEYENIISNIMADLNGKEIEGIREGNLISIVGYSKKIPEWISYGGKKVNLNIALRYNTFEDKTYLWLGSPLISIAY